MLKKIIFTANSIYILVIMIFGLKKYSVIIYTITLLLLSVSIVVYIFPKDKKFEYSFSEGNPWLHENMIADFDFPIYKSDKELKHETDSIKKNFIPYYIVDTSVFLSTYSYLIGELNIISNTKISEIILEDSLLTINSIRYYEKSFFVFKNSIDSLLKTVYNKGVIVIPDTVSKSGDYKFFVYNNHIFELSFANEFYLQTDVNELVRKTYEQSGVRNIDSILHYPVLNILKSNIIKPSIVYDITVNRNILEKQISSVSPTMGIIQKGELIIQKGTIVSEKENKVLLSLKREYEANQSGVNHFMISIGVILLFLSLYSVVYLYYFYVYNREILLRFKNATFFTLQMLSIIFAVFIVFKYTDLSINIIPFTLVPVVLITFYKFHVSFFVYLLTIFVAGFFAPNSFDFIFIQTITGMVAMFSLRKKQKRQQIFITLLLVFVSYMILYIGFVLMRQGTISELLKKELFSYAISSVFLLLYIPIVYICEKVFRFLSDFTLMEISDTNNTILRELAEKAPGTFQHSIQVSSIVEAAVRELGGNALLARVGALYHDIGKLGFPEYYIENQSGVNIHDTFDYEESAQKIISHVSYGVELAQKNGLPKQVINYISMHHGTSLTRYFYNSWINANPGLSPNLSNFKYPGPKPQTLEIAIMMMADSVEAASRSLKEYTPESIEKLVNNIVNAQLEDGQFDEVDITFKQITTAKKIFISKIKNIYHARIVYPGLYGKNG